MFTPLSNATRSAHLAKLWRSTAALLQWRRVPQRRLLFLLLVRFLGLLGGLGLGFALGAFFAFDFFLALLDDFGLGWSCGFRGHGLDRLLFFDLESDNVG